MKLGSRNKMFGGEQALWSAPSAACNCDMQFAVFIPPGKGPFPVLYWLSGLTCTPMNFVEKAGAQKLATELGIILVAPDTSPRGEGVADDAAYDLGQGAGFYLSTTQNPWREYFQMDRWIIEELVPLIDQKFATDPTRRGIFGHSMGGHGALTLHLKRPDIFKTCSAFSPIVAPMQVPWGQKAFRTYLGDNQSDWKQYDACQLVEASPGPAHILIDQGLDDTFLAEQLRPELFELACKKASQQVTVRRQVGYDHSYYFIASFIEDHLRWHEAQFDK
ncbi:MAG: S-formylglutathione hydrolase [Robiginitomaculum sp.]|nr:MAG: S-formylglutathione hydrolase [Robiginitomaculum sp.]